MVKILFLGDIVGKPGRQIIQKALPILRDHYQLDLIVANGENAAGGSGIDLKCHRQIVEAGVAGFTMGDHIYKNAEIQTLFQNNAAICKPANYPAEAPGPDHLVLETKAGVRVAVISIMGRVFMRPVDCPFVAVDRVLAKLPNDVKVILVDVHAEATSDKQLLGRYLADRVSAIVGTHTHVPTADAQILPPGAGYITDLGMTGPYDSIIGRRYDRILKTAKTFEPTRFDVATGDHRISGVLLDIGETTGKCRSIELVHKNEQQLDEMNAQRTAALG